MAGGHSTTILGGGDIDPIRVDPNNPLVLVIVQLCLILILSRILAFAFKWARQPRVVSEILAGILLGPTAFGQIPGFTENIFPSDSIPYLSLIANLGLVLFLFVIGTDVDFSLLRRNARPTLAVSTAGLVIPFGLGCAVSVGLYNEFIDSSIKFTTFMTFIGTSSSITAFPVLSRILSELQLFSDPVGLVVLASGVVNDVIGWCLLALSVALASAGSGVVVVYILLTMLAWTLALFFIGRPALNWLARKTGSWTRPDGPTQGYVCAVLGLVLVSAFFCQIIGISEIFGGFLVGLIIPRSLGHHFAQRIEDLVTCIFIPLYFATSGLRTDLTLLNSGIIWAWVICVMVVAFSGKFFGSAIAARMSGFGWRQSGATGALMSAKGLIELIVLNQGLQVGIISQTVFSIFVLEALVLTIAATPLTLAFYPPHHRPSNQAAAAATLNGPSTSDDDKRGFALAVRKRFTVVLDQLESFGAVMVLTHLLTSASSVPGGSTSPPKAAARSPQLALSEEPTTSGTVNSTPRTQDTLVSTTQQAASKTATPDMSRSGSVARRLPESDSDSKDRTPLTLIPLRLVELTERGSDVMLASAEAASHLAHDALVALYRTFASLLATNACVDKGEFAMTAAENWPETVARCAAETESDMVWVPWRIGGACEDKAEMGNVVEAFIPNPFEALFGNAASGSTPSAHASGAPLFAAFLRDLFLEASCDVGVLLDGTSSTPSLAPPASNMHLFLPFFGGADDREPTELDRTERITSTEDGGDALSTTRLTSLPSPGVSNNGVSLGAGYGGTIQRAGETQYGTARGGSDERGLASETADGVALEQARLAFSSLDNRSVSVENVSTAFPLETMLRRHRQLSLSHHQRRLITLVGRSRLDAPSHRLESLALLRAAEKDGRLGACASSEVRRAIGEAATALVLADTAGDCVLVVQSRATAGQRSVKRMQAARASLAPPS
ncbi:K(+)/H(+) antiporter [Rhodotorula mucilaginosa]|uniref:K(+)/H(+) antiporter n=1 Tax=Rhodotorula mucilaginosa TaxID=5537 RepID=A0A9P6VTJ9_RHOMI|nr:K(+)/H(+) antiporter [Rhodotorula mucilaginosa]